MDPLILLGAPAAPAPVGCPYDQPPMIARERRLHARAYQHWTSLRGGRRLPCIADLHPRALAEFASSSVLVELGAGARPPAIHFLGQAIAAEGGLATETPAFETVPRGSLLGQLLRRLPTVRDRGAPVSFEADFPGGDGAPTHYRGILLPFADAGGAIAYVYGVISWRLAAPAAIDPDVAASIAAAVALPPPMAAPSAWASERPPAAERLPLAQQLAAARTWAALGEADPARRVASLAAALSATHDLRIAAEADPAAFALLSAEAGVMPGGAIGAMVRLVFGREAPRMARARHMAVLAHARRLGIGPGMLLPLLERHPGGAAALAEAEGRARRLERGDRAGGSAHRTTDTTPPPGRIAFAAVDPDRLLLLAQRGPRRLDRTAPGTDPQNVLAGASARRLAAT